MQQLLLLRGMLYSFTHRLSLFLAILYANVLFANNGDTAFWGVNKTRIVKLHKQAQNQHNRLIESSNKRVQVFSKIANKVHSKLVYVNPEAAKLLRKEIDLIEIKLRGVILSMQQVDSLVAKPVQIINGYRSKADSLKTAFSFLAGEMPETSSGTKNLLRQVGDYYTADDLLDVASQLKECYQLLASYMAKFGLAIGDNYFSNEFRKIYQLRTDIESLSNDPDKAVKRLLDLAYRQPAFASFFKNNSQFAAIFGMNSASLGGAGNGTVPIAGLQERMQISQALTQSGLSMPAVPQNAMMPNFSSPFEALKQRINQTGASGYEDLFTSTDITQQQRKPFFRHFEIGVNLQTSRSRNGFPASADMGISIGYKIKKQAVIGVGAAYKLGIGESLQKIALSNEGIELRTFADVKIKKSFWATAGYELHHYKAFQSIAEISKYNLWQRSVLVGISKKIQIGNKKSAKMQILWQPISFPANSISSPIKFRIGYQL